MLSESLRFRAREHRTSTAWRAAAAPAVFGLLGVAFFWLYALTLTQWYSFDTVAYAQQVRMYDATGSPGWLFHPHHLLFNVCGLAVHRLLSVVDPDIRTITSLQMFTALMGGVGVLAFAGWLHETSRSLWTATAGAIALGGSYGWWFGSTDGRANTASAAVLFLALWALTRAVRKTSAAWACGAGALLGLACLLHESHVLFLPAGALTLALSRGRWRHRLRWVACFGFTFTMTFGLAYAIVIFVILDKSLPEATHWMLSYANEGIWWDFRIVRNLSLGFEALVRAITGQPVRIGGQGIAWGGRENLAVITLWFGLAIPAIVKWRHLLHGRVQRRVAPVLVALMVYTAFFTVWTPGYFVFWIAQGAFAIGLLALGWRSVERYPAARTVISILVLATGVSTFAASILPRVAGPANPHMEMAQDLDRLVDSRGLLVLSGMGWNAEAEAYVPYFTGISVIAVHSVWGRSDGDPHKATRALRKQIDHTLRAGKPVYIMGDTLFGPDVLDAMAKRYGLSPGQTLRIFAPYRRLAIGEARGTTIFELKPQGNRPQSAKTGRDRI